MRYQHNLYTAKKYISVHYYSSVADIVGLSSFMAVADNDRKMQCVTYRSLFNRPKILY